MAKCFLTGLLGLVCLSGCTMCACPYDDDYPVIESDFPPPGAAPPAVYDDGVASNQAAHSIGPARYSTGPRLTRDE